MHLFAVLALLISVSNASKTLLRIAASANGNLSSSRMIMEEFTAALLAKDSWKIVDRDLNSPQIPHMTKEEAEAGRTPIAHQSDEQKQYFSLANELTNEVVYADHIVIATPMHNWGAPSALKAWVDRVVNSRTFYTKDEHITDTHVTFIVSSGGPYSILDSLKPYDHLRPWLSYVFQQIGAQEKNIRFINVDPTGRGVKEAYERARGMIEGAVNREEL